jgi:hypothetical protein
VSDIEHWEAKLEKRPFLRNRKFTVWNRLSFTKLGEHNKNEQMNVNSSAYNVKNVSCFWVCAAKRWDGTKDRQLWFSVAQSQAGKWIAGEERLNETQKLRQNVFNFISSRLRCQFLRGSVAQTLAGCCAENSRKSLLRIVVKDRFPLKSETWFVCATLKLVPQRWRIGERGQRSWDHVCQVRIVADWSWGL